MDILDDVQIRKAGGLKFRPTYIVEYGNRRYRMVESIASDGKIYEIRERNTKGVIAWGTSINEAIADLKMARPIGDLYEQVVAVDHAIEAIGRGPGSLDSALATIHSMDAPPEIRDRWLLRANNTASYQQDRRSNLVAGV